MCSFQLSVCRLRRRIASDMPSSEESVPGFIRYVDYQTAYIMPISCINCLLERLKNANILSYDYQIAHVLRTLYIMVIRQHISCTQSTSLPESYPGCDAACRLVRIFGECRCNAACLSLFLLTGNRYDSAILTRLCAGGDTLYKLESIHISPCLSLLLFYSIVCRRRNA